MKVLTRGDLDGLTSSVFLTMVREIGEIRFAHPKDVQDGMVEASADDIVVNLPYVKGCGMWFDHHISEEKKAADVGEFEGKYGLAPSTARLIYDHFQEPEFDRFKEMLEETDRFDSAQLEPEDVTNPRGWVLLGFTLDPRTGLGPEFRKYFRWLVEYVKEVPLEKVLQHGEVKKRADRVRNEIEQFKGILTLHCRLEGNVIVTDLRRVKDPPVGNRFLVYTLYPEANVEARIIRGKGGETLNVAVGKSIFNRTCKTNVGMLCAEYGGGGHEGAGTCQFKPEEAEAKINEIVGRLKTTG